MIEWFESLPHSLMVKVAAFTSLAAAMAVFRPISSGAFLFTWLAGPGCRAKRLPNTLLLHFPKAVVGLPVLLAGFLYSIFGALAGLGSVACGEIHHAV